MYVLEVTPTTPLPSSAPQVLSYFWQEALPQGALVRIPLGRRTVPAIVLESTPLAQMRIRVKKSSFQLKKIDGVIAAAPQVSAPQLALAHWLAEYTASPLSTCIRTTLPSFSGVRGYAGWVAPDIAPHERSPAQPTLAIGDTAHAQRTIRDILVASTGTVLLILPDAQRIAEWDEKDAVVLLGDQTNKKTYDAYCRIASGDVRFAIGTRSALFAPWKSLATIIVDDALHESYKSERTPKYNTPDVARAAAQLYGARLVLTTPAPSAANTLAAQRGTVRVVAAARNPSPALQAISMTEEAKTGNHTPLSRSVERAIIANTRENERTLLYSARRAYAAALSCRTCGTPVGCAACSSPMRLHATAERMLVCYHCGSFTEVPKQCHICHSEKLYPAGSVGSQRIAEAAERLLAYHEITAPAIILDSDLTRTDRHEHEIIERIDAAPNAVVVATNMIFSHRARWRFPATAVIDLDALTFHPDFRTEERLIWQVEHLRSMTSERLFLQYRMERPLLEHIASGNYDAWFEQELAIRKALGYPPYSRVVRLSYSHTQRSDVQRNVAACLDRMQRATQQLRLGTTARVLGSSSALVERSADRYAAAVLLQATCPPDALNRWLAYVPPRWNIDVDPRSIV